MKSFELNKMECSCLNPIWTSTWWMRFVFLMEFSWRMRKSFFFVHGKCACACCWDGFLFYICTFIPKNDYHRRFIYLRKCEETWRFECANQIRSVRKVYVKAINGIPFEWFVCLVGNLSYHIVILVQMARSIFRVWKFHCRER